MDHPILNNSIYCHKDELWKKFFNNKKTVGKRLKNILEDLKNVAIETNKEWADILGVSPSTAITCVKPSGTVSQLVNSSSGIHPRHSPFYVRTVRNDKKDPLSEFMVSEGFPVEDDIQILMLMYFHFLLSPLEVVLIEMKFPL